MSNDSIQYNCPIRFPGLLGDWEFTAPCCFKVGTFTIHWYGVLITLGLLIAVWYCLRNKERYGITEDDFMDTLIAGIPCGVIGARIYYVLFYLDLFRNADGSFQWGKAVAVWDGGLAIYGAVIAILTVSFGVCRVKKLKLMALTDFLVPGLLIGQIVGRWGNFMNREAFGDVTELPWRMELITKSGEAVCVHPTFLYESLWNLVGLILVVLIVSKDRRFDGENTWFYCLWYGFGRFLIEGLRADSLYLFNWELFGERIRVSQALSLVLVFTAALMLYYHLKVAPHKPEELFANQLAIKKEQDEVITEEESTDAN